MNNKVIQFPHSREQREKVREQACQWLALLDAGASQDEQERLGAWMGEDSLHTEILLEMADLWDQMAMLSELSNIFPLQEYGLVPVNRRVGRRGMLTAGIAMLLGAAVLNPFSLKKLGLRGSAETEQNLVHYTHETAVGEQLTVNLPDGSEIILNTHTKIEVSYSDTDRNVTLKYGEGLFSVAKDALRPFRVYAGTRVVEAVGTTFTVQRTEQEDIEVIVREGKVNFFRVVLDQNSNPILAFDGGMQNLPGNIALVAGERAITEDDSVQKNTIELEEIEARLSWSHGMLLFRGEPLEQVLKEVGRYTVILIEADAEIRDIQVEGYFRAGDIDGLLLAMQSNFQIEARYLSAKHILLTPN